ncbi:MAG: peptidoglycan-associated lipoprotein Pal [Deltaproteobacteria bacterium]|nr:peptidoglycan-associated lipoprotein Pal [Deltaproteobacteria bacterium]
MKKRNACKLFLVMSLSVLLCVACAKKPATTSMEEGYGSGTEAAGTSELDTPAYGAIGESSVGEEGAATEKIPGMGDDIRGLERIHFEFDQYTLTAEAREILARNAQFLQIHNTIRVIIEGHCDERGSDEYNLALGERRARAVKDYMGSLGIPASQMSIISYGEEIPLDPQSGEEAWAKNRRADFKQAN